jgi:hypothetical protein
MRGIGLVVVNIVVLTWFLAPWRPHLDLDVYRLGARMWLSGGDLYGLLPPTIIGNHLPFTYPPVAAVLFTPFTLVPLPVAGVVLTALSVVALVVVPRLTPARVAVVLPVALLLEPVRETLGFGQVNLLLMALVALDCLHRRPRWPRGVLVGLAAAIKLTPARVRAVLPAAGRSPGGGDRARVVRGRHGDRVRREPGRFGEVLDQHGVRPRPHRRGVVRGEPVDQGCARPAGRREWSGVAGARRRRGRGGGDRRAACNAYVWFAVAVLWRSADRQLRRPRVDVDHRAVA